MARLGVAPHVADKILNHQAGTISGVAAVYQRHDFLAERKDGLERWGALGGSCRADRCRSLDRSPQRYSEGSLTQGFGLTPFQVHSYPNTGHGRPRLPCPLRADAVEKVGNESGVARAGVFQRQVLSLRLRFQYQDCGAGGWQSTLDATSI